MALGVAVLRFIGFVSVILFFFAVGGPYFLLFKKPNPRLIQFCSQMMLVALGVRVKSKDHSKIKSWNGMLIVSNHLSYLDIVILSSLVPCAFVTSTAVRDTPFLGWICRVAGCVFVDRVNFRSLPGELTQLYSILDAGMNVCIFPESTSSNGDRVLPFKRAMFKSVEGQRRFVVPVTLQYRKVGGEKLSLKNRDLICWYGNMPFFPHFLKLISASRVKVETCFHPRIDASLNSSARLAGLSWQAVVSHYHPSWGKKEEGHESHTTNVDSSRAYAHG